MDTNHVADDVEMLAYGTLAAMGDTAPAQERNVAYAKAIRALYARHGITISRDDEERLKWHEKDGGFVNSVTRRALAAGITPLEIVAVARLAYSEGKS